MAVDVTVSLAPRGAAYPWIMQVLQCTPAANAPAAPAAYPYTFQIAYAPATTDDVTPEAGSGRTLNAGDLGITVVLTDSPAVGVTVTDTQGNTWQHVSTATSAAINQDVFICPGARALGPTDTVTVTAAAPSATGIITSVYGMSGVTYVTAVAASGDTATASATVPQVPSGPIVLIAVPATGQDTTITSPPNWTQFGFNCAFTWSDSLAYYQETV